MLTITIEWIPPGRIDLTQEVEWPQPDASSKRQVKHGSHKILKTGSGQKRPHVGTTVKRELSPVPSLGQSLGNKTASFRPPLAGGKENSLEASFSALIPETQAGTPRPEDEDIDLEDVQDAAAAAKAGTHDASTYSREEEIEKLRTSGSLTQNQAEISRVRNLSKIAFGEYEIEPWYFSPYPMQFSEAPIVYICEFCLSYFDEARPFERHRKKCTMLHPPGNEIYRDNNVSFFEIDGRRQRTWCRNLCLLSKLFLDHKTLFYDVDPFLFYCMCSRTPSGCHLVGYFSKEKESAEGYNVACIMTLPQFQRKGYGRLLIAFSYELSRREGKLGSPEKPLSDLGLLGYRAYWQEAIVAILMEEGRSEISVDELAALTAMTVNDVYHTLQNLNMLRYSKGAYVIVKTDGMVVQYQKALEKEKNKGKRKIEAVRLQWKPPIFNPSSRTWAW